jgi:hypothetical protein
MKPGKNGSTSDHAGKGEREEGGTGGTSRVHELHDLHDLSLGDAPLATGVLDRLLRWIGDFESELDDSAEVGARLVSYGDIFTMHLTDISYWSPQLVRFAGFDAEGRPMQVIQHVSQINLLLLKLPALGDSPIRIGIVPPGRATRA